MTLSCASKCDWRTPPDWPPRSTDVVSPAPSMTDGECVPSTQPLVAASEMRRLWAPNGPPAGVLAVIAESYGAHVPTVQPCCPCAGPEANSGDSNDQPAVSACAAGANAPQISTAAIATGFHCCGVVLRGAMAPSRQLALDVPGRTPDTPDRLPVPSDRIGLRAALGGLASRACAVEPAGATRTALRNATLTKDVSARRMFDLNHPAEAVRRGATNPAVGPRLQWARASHRITARAAVRR